jgi:hypothetical protein
VEREYGRGVCPVVFGGDAGDLASPLDTRFDYLFRERICERDSCIRGSVGELRRI